MSSMEPPAGRAGVEGKVRAGVAAGRRDAPAPVGARDEPLRDDVAERLREARADDLLLVLRVEADDAVDGLRGVDGVERREDEVPRLGGFERDLGRLVVAHLADEDDL